jgi:DNA transposition AAA+ family ATPase
MAVSKAERERLAGMKVPPASEVRERIVRYLSLADMTASEFAARIGYSKIAAWKFLEGKYDSLAGTDVYFRAAAVDYMEKNAIEVEEEAQGRLFVTQNYQRIRRYVLAACERSQVCLLYGPPGTQKTFVIQHLVAGRNREKKNDAVYVYASMKICPRALLKRIASASGAIITSIYNDQILNGLVRSFRARRGKLAIIMDEAQHLTVEALEILRELHDRSGCGLVLAGSHNLYENFLRGREHLEQWLSRIDHKDPLPGLLEDELREIASRELGNGQPVKLSEKQFKTLLDACRVDDIFARGPGGKPQPRKYLSVRRLVKVLAGHKTARQEAA